MRRNNALLCVTMLVAGTAVWFVVSTLLIGEAPDAVIMASSLLVALAFVSAFVGTPVRERVRTADRPQLVLAAVAGVLAWYATPAITLSQRATDAPSGTETLFFMTAGALLSAVVVSSFFADERPTLTQVAGALTAVLGAAALLGNWERPSSFSPFLKFPVQEGIMLIAGVVLALGLIAGRRSASVLGLRSTLWLGIAAATCVAVVASIPDVAAALGDVARLWPQLMLTGVALSTLATGLSGLVQPRGVVRGTMWLLLTPIAMTTLTVVERITGAYGPVPIVWAGASGGVVLSIVGLAIVDTARSVRRSDGTGMSDTAALAPFLPAPRPRALLAVIAAASVALATAVVALFLPAFIAVVVGTTEAGSAYSARWAYSGAESAVGWLALCVAFIGLAVAVEINRRIAIRAALVALAAGFVSALSYPLVLATPLHTWTRWIPAEIQQAYGTEYARLTFTVAPSMPRLASVVLAAAACVTLIVIIVLRRDADGVPHSPALKENA